MGVCQAVQRPMAILVTVLALMFCFSTVSLAASSRSAVDDEIEMIRIDRDAARTRSAFYSIGAVVLFAVCLAAAPITGGLSIVAVASLSGAIAAGAAGYTNQMEANRLNRKMKKWSDME